MVDHLTQDLTNDATPKKRPFHVVLIDLKQAANWKLVCVEKPLMGDHDLNFVALSYRWGELHETMVDTRVGYLAAITSFKMHAFFHLCRTMCQERDLKHVDYVWVDTICVDQVDPIKRKETIYQMTNIYERANYIVAVPDLNFEHWEMTHQSLSRQLNITYKYNAYMYYILHGDIEKIAQADKAMYRLISAPNDPVIQQFLSHYTAQFGDHFMKQHHKHQSETDVANTKTQLDDVTTTMLASLATYDVPDYGSLFNGKGNQAQEGDAEDFFMNTQGDDDDDAWSRRIQCAKWKQLESERSNLVENWVFLLMDFIKDWSSRAWVINEYSIATKKSSQKMKLWFLQLRMPNKYVECLDFFEFDFGAPNSIFLKNKDTLSNIVNKKSPYYSSMDRSQSFYGKYLSTLMDCIRDNTFIEKILKSKASRNEDRFHSILPNSNYKTLLTGKNPIVSGKGEITTIMSVKLKVYERMDVKDKLELLFLSGKCDCVGDSGTILPTFTTSTIDWPERHFYPVFESKEEDTRLTNFDMTDTPIVLIPPLVTDKDHDHPYHGLYKLKLKPKEYYLFTRDGVSDHLKQTIRIDKRLELDDPTVSLDMICITCFGKRFNDTSKVHSNMTNFKIFLVGSFVENRWFLHPSLYIKPRYTHHYYNGSGFHIY